MINRRADQIIPLIYFICFSFSCKAADYYYYCPKGNVSLVGGNHYLTGTASTAFPTSRKSDLNSQYSPGFYWEMVDCSNNSFLCFDAREQTTGEKKRVFVPRKPKIGTVYQYDGARAFVVSSASSSKIPTVQVIVSQNDNRGAKAIKLTLQKGRGVIFIDGLNFWDHKNFRQGETCALESYVGYFAESSIAVPAASVITDF